MLIIDPGKMIGKGLHRECFEHPDNPHWCVKIVVAGNSNENHREAAYYKRLSGRGISWEMLTRFHGLVDTSMGEGAVFDLVKDYTGEVSGTLTRYLASEELTSSYSAVLAGALIALKAYLMENRVITMTLKTKNIVFQRGVDGQGKLVIVDNVGNSDFIPAADYSAFLARLKIQRKWHRFEKVLRESHPGNKVVASLPG
jgi:hypothetical protein